jgi:DNA-binding response OmpR family regulator
VVDQDPRILNFLNLYLSARDYQPILVPSGAEALKQIKTQKPDIAILGDFESERSGNLNLLRGLRTRSNLPVIILSAYGEDQDKIAGIVSGADDYMSKPFNPQELFLRIKAVLRRSDSSISREKSVRAKLDSMMLTDGDTVVKWARYLLYKKEEDTPK